MYCSLPLKILFVEMDFSFCLGSTAQLQLNFADRNSRDCPETHVHVHVSQTLNNCAYFCRRLSGGCRHHLIKAA